MPIPRWNPSTATTKQEAYLLSRLTRTRRLYRFLRLHRRDLFDESFQDELETMYRATGAGKPPCPPALLAMACLLQGYQKVSDAEAVELTVVDLRWQMVLERLGEDNRSPAPPSMASQEPATCSSDSLIPFSAWHLALVAGFGMMTAVWIVTRGRATPWRISDRRLCAA